MTLEHARTLAEGLMALFGLLEAGWVFGFNQRKRAMGICDGGRKRIELSEHMVMLNANDVVMDTILHEIAHALVGVDKGHGPEWKRKCKEIGCNPTRTTRGASMPMGKWRSTCRACGFEHSMHREPKTARRCLCHKTAPVLIWKKRA